MHVVLLFSLFYINFNRMIVNNLMCQQQNILLLCCSGILLIAEVISRFKKIGSFVRKLRKLGFGLENKVCLV